MTGGTGSKWGGESARGYNRASVMKLVLEEPGIDRTRLAEETGLTNAAMTRIVQELINADMLKEVGALKSDGSRGRRRKGLQINGQGGFVIGLSILAFNSSVALTDLSGKTIAVAAVEPSNIADPKSTLDEICTAALDLIAQSNIDSNRILGAGAAIAGHLNSSGNVWDRSPYLGWPALDIRRSLTERLNYNLAVENVNRCIAVAESRLGCCAGSREVVLIRAALGIGGAIITSGEILRGQKNQAGEIGHIPAEPNGVVCSCGKTGCLNTLASGQAVLARLGLADDAGSGPGSLESREMRLKNVLSRAGGGDENCRAAVRDAGRALGWHCAGMLRAFDPQTILLTGPLGRNHVYANAFCEALADHDLQDGIITAHDHDITPPAPAASALALATHVYAPSFDIRRFLDPAGSGLNQDSAEALIV